MTRTGTQLQAFTIAVFVAAMIGCDSGGPRLYEVAGTLKYQGQPLSGVDIFMSPVDGRRGSAGRTDDAGQFYMYFTGDSPGVAPGEHIVHIMYFPSAAEDGGLAGEQGNDKKLGKDIREARRKYGTKEDSPYRVTIDSAEDNLTIDLE